MLGAQMLRDARGGLDRVPLEALYRGVRGLLVEVTQDHRARHGGGLLLTLGAR